MRARIVAKYGKPFGFEATRCDHIILTIEVVRRIFEALITLRPILCTDDALRTLDEVDSRL